MKLFVPEVYISNINLLYQGTPISNYYHIKALSALRLPPNFGQKMDGIKV